MNYNDLLLEKLKSDLIQHSITQELGLSENKQWMQSHFEALSLAINAALSKALTTEQHNSLGTTISVSTLERIFKHGYIIPTPIDGRRLKTLNKLSIVLGHEDWNAFSKDYLQSLKAPYSLQDVKELIKKALEAEFKAYQNIPKEDSKELQKYYTQTGSAYLKILANIESAIIKQHTLKNKRNPSTFELLDVAIKESLDGEIIATTKEYWYLSWYNTKAKRYQKSYNVINEQIYILTETEEGWKIRVNIYNADRPKSPEGF